MLLTKPVWFVADLAAPAGPLSIVMGSTVLVLMLQLHTWTTSGCMHSATLTSNQVSSSSSYGHVHRHTVGDASASGRAVMCAAHNCRSQTSSGGRVH